jgi:3-oxoacyl-[acyl-carrier-protein] synthase-1
MTAVITSIGAVTSVGRDALASCAAIRARISRPRKVRHFRVVDEETQEEVGLTGHPLKGYTEGFDLVGRWLRLALGGLEDLLGVPEAPRADDARFWARTALLGVLPPAGDLLPMNEEEAGPLAGLTLERLREELDLAVPTQSMEVVALGHAGLAAALERGLRLLAAGPLERVLVVAADSCLTSMALNRLAHERRLKTDTQPVGLMPGEAGVCFLLEREVEARRRGATPLARVSAAAMGQETSPDPGRRHFSGIALAECVRQTLERAAVPMPFGGDLHVDLNGEPWRSRLWGSALTRLRPLLANPRVHTVASSLGDTGSASGALGLCLATYELAWGHARSRLALVVSSSDDGTVGCVALQGLNGPLRSSLLGKDTEEMR